MSSNAREQILSTLRKALKEHRLPMPFPEADKAQHFFQGNQEEPEVTFASQFTALGGKYIYCADEEELIQNLQTLVDTMGWQKIHCRDTYLLQLVAQQELEWIVEAGNMDDIQVGISLCEHLVARTGSVLLSAAQEYGRQLPVYAPIHITVAFSNQLVWDIKDAMQAMQGRYQEQLPSMISLTTGPSRTADIEKTLVVGVHGPKEVYVFYVDRHVKA